MSYKLAQWLNDRGTILVNALCGLISPQWFEDDAAFRLQMLRDYIEMEDLRDSESSHYVCDACSPLNKPN